MARSFMFAALCQRAHPLKHSLAESEKQRKKIFVRRKIRQQGHSLAEVSLYVYNIFLDIKKLAYTIYKYFVIILTLHDDFFPRMSCANIIFNILKNLRIKLKVQILYKPRLYSGHVCLFILQCVCVFFIRCLVMLFYTKHVYSSLFCQKWPVQFLEAHIVVLINGKFIFFSCLIK